MVIVIAGPTASGKSSLALEVAQRLNGEIISADSMQIYREMDIGTAKIAPSDRMNIPHHMLDIVDPKDEFSVAEYAKLAENKINEIETRNKTAIICGGTGLYIESLLYPFDYGGTEKNEDFRNQLYEEVNRYGNRFLHDKLKILSPESAEAIHENNVKRIIRAIEIATFGQTVSKKNEDRVPKRKFLYFVLQLNREVLYHRIHERVDEMIEQGLQTEVENLISKDVNFSMQSMQGIGYKEWKTYFSGLQSLREVIATVKTNTRHYAKRQETWFRREQSAISLNAENATSQLAKKICYYYENELKLKY